MSPMSESGDTITIPVPCIHNDQNNNSITENDDTVNGMVDYAGQPAKRSQSGYWRSASYIIGVGAAERFAYYGISSNLITYLTGPLGQPTAGAAASINIWSGTGSVLPLLGAFLADSYLGRFRTILLSSLLYILALGLLSASTLLDGHGQGQGQGQGQGNDGHELEVFFFFVGLYLMAVGQGAHKPCIMAFGADQFDEQHPQELRSRSSFFNWWYFGLCAAPLAALSLLNYIQDNIGWGIGFGIPCISMAIALAIFMLGTKTYRYSMDHKYCDISRVAQVFIRAALINWKPTTAPADADELEEHEHRHHPDTHYCYYSQQSAGSLNKALLAPAAAAAAAVREVEAAKLLVNLMPLWATCLAFAIVLAQPSTLFTKQGVTMDRSILGLGFDVPAASLQYIIGLTIVILIPMYDGVFVGLARIITGIPSGITKLQRIGTGMVFCTLSMVTAALVERKRLKTAAGGAGLYVSMSFLWLIPQYVLYAMAEVFTLIGLQELFYDQVPCGLKSIGLSIYLSILGMGNFLSSFLISVIQLATAREDGQGGWFSDNTNGAHLDYFYWLLAGLNAIGFLTFLYWAKCFSSRHHV